jgi:lambda family phage portal protein
MAVAHDDLAARPLKPSRVLTQWAGDRQRQRRQHAAERELRDAMAQMRTFGRAAPRAPRSTGPAHPGADAPQPGFPVVGGMPARGAAPAERAFDAAGTDRLTVGWLAANTGINADLEHALSTLRARSRDWCQNTDAGERFLALVADNVIGAEPPRLQVRARLANGQDLDEVANTAVEDAWWQWCQRGQCEITGRLSFADVCRTLVAAAARDGEFLVRRVRDNRLPHGYALQLLDVDRIDTGANLAPGVRGVNAVRLGVEIDPFGRPVALRLHDHHPADSGAGIAPRTTSGRVAMDELIHGFVLRRPEQVRGYPWTANILKRAHTLADYEHYALIASKIGAAKMGFYVTDKDAVNADMSLNDMRDATGALVQDVEPGMLEALPPGVSFDSFDPDYPHANFGAFVTACLRGIASGLNVAHHNLTGDMTGVNYSSARIAELTERRHWRSLQRWFIDCFVRPVFEEWLAIALMRGQIRLPSGAVLPAERLTKFAQASTFQPPAWPWVDPKADIEAATQAVQWDVKSLRQLADENGTDLEDTLMDKARLLRRYQQLGLPVPAWLGGAQAPASAAAPAAEPDDDAEADSAQASPATATDDAA